MLPQLSDTSGDGPRRQAETRVVGIASPIGGDMRGLSHGNPYTGPIRPRNPDNLGSILLRETGAMTELHPWPAAIARQLAADLAEVVSAHLVAVYLHGSAVLGSWVPGRSDVDVLIVGADGTSETIADSMADAIVRTQLGLVSEHAPPPKLETSIVTAAAARHPRPPWPFLRHVVTDSGKPARVVRHDKRQGDHDLAMHYAVCRAAGYAAFGPPPADVIGPVARADILGYLAGDLAWGLANAPERYSVLNACRALRYWNDGVIVSKIDGGEAALQNGMGPADVITHALAQQRGVEPDQPPAAEAIAFVEEIAALLRGGV
jgi:streptomycin 3"-adenylyltransferase